MMKKTIAAFGLSAALAIPSVAMATTVEADDVDDTTIDCPYDGVRNEDGTGSMLRNRGQVQSRAVDGLRFGNGNPSANGHGARDGSGPINLVDGMGGGNRHGANS